MTQPASLKELAARVVADEYANVQNVNLPDSLVEYVQAMQGVSLNLAYEAIDNYNALMTLIRDRNEELGNLDVCTQFHLSAQQVHQQVNDALTALANDLNLILSEGSTEWQEYAVPLLTEIQTTLLAIEERMATVVWGLEIGIEEINNPTM